MKIILIIGRLLYCLLFIGGSHMICDAQKARITITENKAEKRVDVVIDGKPFTSYLYPDSLKKPVLYPIFDADGAFITRGWPLAPRSGEPVDHPHHIGLWFNYENVNGLDFWNNSAAIPNDKKQKYGTIKHFSVDKVLAVNNKAVLKTTAYWENPGGKRLLKQNATYSFAGAGGDRSIELLVQLTALKEDVNFTDTKDGLIGLRLARALEQPSAALERVTDAVGKVSKIKKSNKDVATGIYRSSEGVTGDAVWGTRAKWVTLNGTLKGKPVSVVILDHSRNIGYPTYWHARGYGLFAANPFGQKVFSKGKQSLDYKLKAGDSVVFRYKVLIHSGGHLSDDQIKLEVNKFERSLN